MVLPLEGNEDSDFSGVAARTKKGFAIIRKELNEMKRSLDLMRDYLSRQKKDYTFYRKDLDERNEEFRKESEEFSSKLVKIKVLLSEFNTLRREIVIQRDLGKIETRIKVSCKKELISCKKENKKLREKLDAVLTRLDALENVALRLKQKGTDVRPTCQEGVRNGRVVVEREGVLDPFRRNLGRIVSTLLLEKCPRGIDTR